MRELQEFNDVLQLVLGQSGNAEKTFVNASANIGTARQIQLADRFTF